MLYNTHTQKTKAIVFVDYEHFYYSMLNNFNMRPNLRGWRNELAEQFDIYEILFFADFSKNGISGELTRLREVSNAIIETRTSNGQTKKDYTDFIILDYIYQKAFTADNIENFIIFTGDGHFSSVVAFLKNRCEKKVGIYGVKNSLSHQLKATANWWKELPDDNEQLYEACRAVIENFRYIERQRVQRGRVIRPSFWGTVDNVTAHYNLDRDLVKDGLSYLMDKQYIYQVEERVSFNEFIKILKVDWEKADADEQLKPLP